MRKANMHHHSSKKKAGTMAHTKKIIFSPTVPFDEIQLCRRFHITIFFHSYMKSMKKKTRSWWGEKENQIYKDLKRIIMSTKYLFSPAFYFMYFFLFMLKTHIYFSRSSFWHFFVIHSQKCYGMSMYEYLIMFEDISWWWIPQKNIKKVFSCDSNGICPIWKRLARKDLKNCT